MYNNFSIQESVREHDIDGRLRVAQSNISKETVNPYYGFEIPNYQGLGLSKDEIYYLYRPGEELAKAASSFNGVQIVETHTPMFGDQPNKELVIGAMGTDAVFEAPYLKNSLMFWDAEAIANIEAADNGLGGAKELSCGYAYDAVMEPGEFEGQHYDGRMTNIIGNHVALVDQGRAGHDVKVADSNIFKDEELMKKKSVREQKIAKVKAMDISIAPEILDRILDAVLGVEQDDAMTNPEPTVTADQKCADEKEDKDDKDDKAMDEEKDDEDDKDKKAEDEKDDEDDKKDKAEDEKEDMQKAMDSLEKKLRGELQAQFRALDEAKRNVREIVGDSLNADSAEEVYRFALDHLSIDHKDIKETAALKMLVKIANDKRFTAMPATKAADIAPMISKFPNVAKIRL
jgi:hypothetical protein